MTHAASQSALAETTAAAVDNEAIIRELYRVAEVKDYAGFAAMFGKDGIFIDEGSGYAYRGEKELARSAEIYATAMPDMHRELYDVYVAGDRVVVELSLNGTSLGPLEIPNVGFVPPTGKKVSAPCCDVFHLEAGKVVSFHCYHELR
ncbi:nuclear transport factor 2 family protein [Glacieibacterium megasporae]|uniref:nuclear transport factor 2 family protein n=1 Tax=Glacieibacterium megasporae TaxID=2835787 RepID=UPI001C1E5C04|nr:nuclear transport factor 2 family protein [Polymorphobacter megasporae]UAJ12451.1 nuclear transport factor 2 family protein [Polymorphobacter megasporae]